MLLGLAMQAVLEPAGESRREGSRGHPDFRLEYEIPNWFHESSYPMAWGHSNGALPFLEEVAGSGCSDSACH